MTKKVPDIHVLEIFCDVRGWYHCTKGAEEKGRAPKVQHNIGD